MQSPTEILDERELSGPERNLVEEMLKRGCPAALLYLKQLDHARVVSRCSCGCASINFAVDGRPAPSGGMLIIADFLFGNEATLCGAFIFEQGGVLAGLEVYGLAGDAPKALPRPEELRPFETGTDAR